ncbi:unnamed protein product [Adineta ricciae]|uniref:Fe2OG dioxygenase domain-containing protein n=1 Tax=Adineta ricciae TaxID=249248 RepID=A0A815AHK5_ADIRI|nr:unnamed protein product [Adineta ricciae]CAF1257447.1 unnamed protein product [Adineta ricciae]
MSDGVVLPIIDYNRLTQKDSTEANKLFHASTNVGFFYLKVNDELDPTPMFTLAEKVFALPLDTKNEYAMDGKNGVYFGYKAVGSMFADRKGTPDTIEFWNISKDDIVIHNSNNFPQVILDQKTILHKYINKSHEIILVILEILSSKLELDPQLLPRLHRITQSSGDQLRLTKSTICPIDNQSSISIALGAHTDFGSITVLFNRLPGLQVLGPDGEWLDVEPLSGHAIVNLGDAMVKLSGGILKSNIHRVVNTYGVTESTDRYSIVYFSRPENDVRMKSLVDNGKNNPDDSDALTAQEWIARRVKNYQTANYKNEETYELSRGTEGNREGSM